MKKKRYTDPYKKLKARDIVEGWPRGKSTGGLGLWSGDENFATDHWFLHFGRASWSFQDMTALQIEYNENCKEHVRAARMFGEYLSRYRVLTEFGDCILDPGHYIDCFGRRQSTFAFRLKSLARKD
jgi:hypothetical protein